MSLTEDLYHEEVLHHATHPENFGVVSNPTAVATGHNPLCGDKVTVSLVIDKGKVTDIRFEGSGCAISQASASLMTNLVKGQTVEKVLALSDLFRHALTTPAEEGAWNNELSPLQALRGVQKFPIRVKCATLAWHALSQAVSPLLIIKRK